MTPRVTQATLAHQSIELGTVLRQYQLGLVTIAGVGDDPERANSLPVQWVHSTDMLDPSPFLTPRTVLLTTGAQFDATLSREAARHYVERLIDVGVTALGFGVGIVWERIPQHLLEAADTHQLPLFRVPYDTPFIAIVQTAARLLDAQIHARDDWALESQRAVASAALQRDGIAAALRESASRLGYWVAVADRTGRITDVAPRTAKPSATAEWIRTEARDLIERGTRGGRVRSRGEQQIHLQTLGRSGHLLGALITPAGSPDHAERTLLGLVAALATVQLEFRTGLGLAGRELRTAIIELLLAGHHELADRVSRGVLPRLPRGRVTVMRLTRLADWEEYLTDDLRSLASGSAGLLAAPYEEGAVLVCESSLAGAVRQLLVDHRMPAGISARGSLSELGELIHQAELALTRALATPAQPGALGPVDYRPAMQAGLLDLLQADPESRRRADALLAPLRQHDARHGDNVTESLAVWLAHHGQTSPAAAELGVHRHTLRTRTQTAASLLQRDLDDPTTRAELWTALRLGGVGGRGGEGVPASGVER